MNEVHAAAVRSWRSAAALVLGLSIALALAAAAISEVHHGDYPGWMIPGAAWGCALAVVLFLEATRQARA